MNTLRFSTANAKTKHLESIDELQKFLVNKRKVYSFDLLSGWSCPGAKDCLSKVIKTTQGKRIKDGPDTKFRCFSASQEVVYPPVYNSRKQNYEAIRRFISRDPNPSFIGEFISTHMPKDLGICRIHVGGDFFNYLYMLGWLEVAAMNPDRLFYAYTKSLPYWLECRKSVNSLSNFVLTASYGGRHDNLIGKHRLRHSKVIFHPNEANGLDIDHDDSHAARPSLKNQNFCLLIHGVQPAKSKASEAIKVLRKEKVQFSYR